MKYLLLLLSTTMAQAELSIHKSWNYIFVDKSSYCSKLCELSVQPLLDEAIKDNVWTPEHTSTNNFDEEIQQIKDFKNKCKNRCKLLKKKRRGPQKRPKSDK